MKEWKELLLVIKRFHLHNKKYAIISYIFGIINIALTSIIALGMKNLLDNATNSQDNNILIKTALFMIIGIFIAKCSDLFRRYLIAVFSSKTVSDARYKSFKHLQSLSIQDFSTISPSYLSGRFSTDMSAIQTLTSVTIPSIITGFIQVIISFILIFSLNVSLALISICVLLLSILLIISLSKKSRKAITEVKNHSSVLTNMLMESIYNQSSIKAFDLQENLINNYNEANIKQEKLTIKSMFINNCLTVASSGLIEFFNIIIICIGAFWIFNNIITVGTLVSFNSLFSTLSSTVITIIAIIPSLVECKVCMHNLELFFEKKPSITLDSNAIEVPESINEISIENLTFGYNVEKPILKNIDLKIPIKKSIAIVGPSGSGKSTIANLLMRFYDPNEGIIKTNDIDYKQLDINSLHKTIGVVPQETILFNDTINNNLLAAKPSANEKEIIKAIKSASADFILNLPGNLSYKIQNEGKSLSSGQRQRLSLARTILRNPKFLILDEATSALDPANEHAINNAVLRLYNQGTSIINITHRLSTITNYDYIYVVSEGKIVENGTHKSLIANKGLYAQLYEKQSGFIVTDDMSSASIKPERLSKINLFSDFSIKSLESLCNSFNSINYPGSHIVISEGDEGDLFYIIVRGRVEVIKRINNQDIKVNILEDGDFFGEIALLSDIPRTATIRTLEPTLLISLKRSKFLELVNSESSINKKLKDTMDKRMQELNKLNKGN